MVVPSDCRTGIYAEQRTMKSLRTKSLSRIILLGKTPSCSVADVGPALDCAGVGLGVGTYETKRVTVCWSVCILCSVVCKVVDPSIVQTFVN